MPVTTDDARVLVPTAAWPDHRFPHWAVEALRAAGARVTTTAGAWPRRWNVALVPAVRPRGAAAAPRRVRRLLDAPHDGSAGRRAAGRVVGLLDAPPRPGDPLLRGPATTLVAPSEALAASWPGPVRVVRPAVAPCALELGAGDDETFRVVCAAPLHWSAGHEHALVAVAALVAAGRRIELRIVGDGPAEEAIRFTAFDLGIEEAVTLLPAAVSVREELRAADALVLPAEEDRAWTALLEAFACGVPAVASDLPTLRELAGGEAALLVPPRDPDSLAAALDSLAADAGVRAELAARGRRAAITDLAACGRSLLPEARR